MKQEQAIAIAEEALIWLASEPDHLAAFLAASGLDPATLRGRAGEPAFLGFVLDHVLAADETVLAFARAAGRAPEEVARAGARLGGPLPNWT